MKRDNRFGGWKYLPLLLVGVYARAFELPWETDPAPDPPPRRDAPVHTPAPAARPGESAVVPAIVARIGNDVITKAELAAEVDMTMQKMQKQFSPEQIEMRRDQITADALNKLIDRRVLSAKVEAEGVDVTEAEIAKEIDRLRATLPPGVDFNEQLAKAGMTIEAFRNSLRMRKLLEKVAGDGDADEAEIIAFYEQHMETHFTMPESVTASHILVSTQNVKESGAIAEARAKIERILAQLRDGADFAALAQAKSSCPSGARGGSLGAFARGQMVQVFEAAAFRQGIGEIGDIVETQFGFHIVKVTDRTSGGVQTLDAVRESIVQHLVSHQRYEAVRSYMEQLREEADVEILR